VCIVGFITKGSNCVSVRCIEKGRQVYSVLFLSRW